MSRSSTRCTSCWCSGGRCSSDPLSHDERREGGRYADRVPAPFLFVCAGPVVLRLEVLAVDAEAGEEPWEERGQGDVRGGRCAGPTFGGGRGEAVRREVVQQAVRAAAQQAALRGGVGGARRAGGLGGGAAVGAVPGLLGGGRRRGGVGPGRAGVRGGGVGASGVRSRARRAGRRDWSGATSSSMASKTELTSSRTSVSWTGSRSRRLLQVSRWEREKVSRVWMGPIAPSRW